ncbi:hypothetical protein LK10_05430 [Sinomonas humi]|uniref:Uncharacterized protein n=1 Tax=Sinomonas humi TaxID=1338436 RepID=A0A0B2ARI8_9MICC|nr:hypothetical protein LK10_05430 [Sinomonas humi]
MPVSAANRSPAHRLVGRCPPASSDEWAIAAAYSDCPVPTLVLPSRLTVVLPQRDTQSPLPKSLPVGSQAPPRAFLLKVLWCSPAEY